MPNGIQLGEQNLASFTVWVNERNINGDWNNYVRGSKLNRSEIAKECGFSTNVFKANGNKEICEMLSKLEQKLIHQGILKNTEVSDVEALVKAENKRTVLKNKKAQENEIELQLLRAENEKLKHQLNHMRNTGLYIP